MRLAESIVDSKFRHHDNPSDENANLSIRLWSLCPLFIENQSTKWNFVPFPKL